LKGGTLGERDERTYAIIGAAMEVHRILGPGHLEAVYHEALELELSLRGIPFEHKPELSIDYKGYTLKKRYYPDLRVRGQIVVELKACSGLYPIDDAQIINSLTCSHHALGLLINFGEASLKWKRFVA
jgi:GxxExxY protein